MALPHILQSTKDARSASDAANAQSATSCWSLAKSRLLTLPMLGLGLAGVLSGSMVIAQGAGGEDKSWTVESEPGIPVTNALVKEKCGTCHAPDAKGNMTRISWSRTTPEGWAQAIRRMTRQHGLYLTPEETREILKYLATWHGLAPEEAKPVMYVPERRLIDETNIPNESVRGACAACHSFGQPLSWRRTKVEWQLLKNMHSFQYSQADAQFRQLAAPADVPGGVPTGGKAPMQGLLGLEYVAKTAPLHTPEWAAWRARLRSPQLEGKWLVTAAIPGKGSYFGTMTVKKAAASDEFTTSVSLRSLTDGSALTRSGTGIVYAGYAWRGRSAGGAGADAAADSPARDVREALWFSPDQKSAEGRWYWGAYQEFGYDVKLTRAAGGPTIAGVAPVALKAGAKGATLRILGDSLPGNLAPSDIQLGAGVKVNSIASASPAELVVNVDVAPGAVAGPRDVSIGGAVLERAFPVYAKVDYLKVTPETAIARLGEGKRPKGYQQFEAIGFDNGPDGKPKTADDVKIGPVEVTWSMEEFRSVFYDDDTKYVGTLSPAALFTPALDGPNPARRFGRNNYGDVWVVATAKGEKDRFGKPLVAKSHMVVTIPAYMHWDQPEVSQ